MHPALSPYLRSLWNVAPTLLDIPAHEAGRPFLSPLGLHLPTHAPVGAAGNWFQAAAAHAAAHLVYSQHRFDPAGLGPVPQALLGTLEDARVEWFACRELPGLRRLWLPFHALVLSDTPSFEDLLRRLARSLLDPQYRDPHPWVAKGRKLFFLDDACDMLALPQPQALRQAASRLGHDIGQMRLQFNARLYQVAPVYRDDNSCLWLADPRRADTSHEMASGPQDHGTSSGQVPVAPAAQLHRYPEWDRLVPMYRPDWCAVLDAPARAVTPDAGQAPWPHRHIVVPPGPRIRLARQLDGDEFDLDALVQAWVARHSGEALEPRVHRQTQRAAHAGATLLLIDASASTAQPFDGTDASVLSATRGAALRCAQAIQRAAGSCAIHSFCSDGRHAVHYERVKDFDEALDAHSVARLMGVRSQLSTRLGAALRHATRLIATRQRGLRRILLLTDGKPQDVDVYDPHYLVEDARQAVREAARRGVLIQCLTLDRTALRALTRVFGPGQVHALSKLEALPAALNRLACNARP